MPNKSFNLIPSSDATEPQKLKVGPQKISIVLIGLRKGADTRPLAAKHVIDLAESIAVLGLLEPLVIDTEGHLLAGGHRLAALHLLAISDDQRRGAYFTDSIDPDDDGQDSGAWATLTKRVEFLGLLRNPDRHFFDGVPVLVVDVRGKDAHGSQRLALAVELAENNVRRSYTAEEIRELSKRLKDAGYKVTEGRPKKGEVTAINVLQAAVGKSKRTIERIIRGKPSGAKTPWENALITFERAAQAILQHGAGLRSIHDKRLVRAAKAAIKLLGKDGSQ